MADQVKQLAFKEFTIAEIQAGTAANVLTTNASTHHVIKSIEATQNDNNNAVTATATLGLTSGLSSGQFASLGTVARKDRVGLSGSAIMDASSTLTIRPTAQTIDFVDENVFTGKNTSAGTVNEIFVKSTFPSVNGTEETTLRSETTVDKNSGTYSGSYDSLAGYPSGNYKVHHTNANGVNLILVFNNGDSSGSSFAVWNADTNVQYGYYNQSYDRPIFDGKRYIFWVKMHGQSQMRVRWYDLDESTTNLTAANTTGGGNGADFWHGQTGIWADSPGLSGRTSYDNHLNAYFQNRHTNNKRYFCGYSNSNNRGWLVEFEDTLSNDGNNPVPKWVYLSTTNNSTSGSTDPFNRNSSAWNMTALINQQKQPTDEAQLQLTYDPAINRYMIWYSPYNNEFWPLTFTQSEFDNISNSGTLVNDGAGDANGIRVVASDSAADINIDTNIAENGGSGNMKVSVGGNNTYIATTTNAYAQNSTSSMSPVYIDKTNFYFRNKNSASSSADKVVKVDASNVTTAVDMIPNTAIPSGAFSSNIFVSITTPSASTIAGRAYVNAPGLKIRVSGIDVDQ